MSDQVTTIQSTDLKRFDRLTNYHLKQGGEIVDGSYQVIPNDKAVTYSQMIKYNQKRYLVSFWDNGNIKSYTRLLLWGIKHGQSNTWDESGSVNGEGSYIIGYKHGVWKEGNPKKTFLEETYFLGYKHGKNNLYKDNFRFHQSEYRWGRQHGTSVEYDKNIGYGHVSKITHYKRGLKYGKFTYYPGNTSFYYQENGQFQLGNKHGYWIKENLDGKVLEKIKWSRGVKHGLCKEYDRESKLTGIGKYKYDYRQGKWIWYDGDKVVKEEIFNDWSDLDYHDKEVYRSLYRSESVLSYWIDKFTL